MATTRTAQPANQPMAKGATLSRPRLPGSRRVPLAGLLASLLALAVSACVAPDAASGGKRSSTPASVVPVRDQAGPEYRPHIDPHDFVDDIDNPLFTLEPGTVFRLRGETESGIEHETITVTNRTKSVLGVTATVVKDVVRVDGRLAELTFDWYAQDRDGNVWYFGEDTAEYEHGHIVSREGSWEAGVDDAQPGIIMSAAPQVTDSFRQEHYRGEAEDMYWVVGTGGSIRVPYGAFDNVVHTLEWTPLEPQIVVEKFYQPGVGLVMERALSGGKEVVELIDVIHR
jgi:hypothetical protein